ncbi:MAG: two-component regulator propeller domain-containing protein [Cyclobacterium sp.]|uniref:sensor histidine kinase n=1 Tax=unclassified Cyclobacterium TaxID=2615055 RepID=UPI0013D59449|nr:sensor histidine kinase [Cyclobacterium sp. SYSU L10401]
MKTFVIIFILLFCSLCPLRAQQRDYTFKNITISEGLSQNSVVDVVEDTTGFIWFATQDGLNRFDGNEFLVFKKFFDDITTPDNTQLGKLASNGHELWLITKGGKLEVLNLFTHEFQEIERIGKENIVVPPATDLFFDVQGNLWIGTLNEGALCYNPRKEEVRIFGEEHLNSGEVRTFFQDSKENLWILTKSGLVEVKPSGTELYLETINTHVMTEDREGNLWVGTFNEGLYRKGQSSQNFEKFTGSKGDQIPSDLIVEAIHVDHLNQLWVGSYGKGLYIIDLKDATFINLMPDIRNPFSIGFQDILSIYEDKKGGIWIGTDGGGVSYYDKQFNNFRRITNQNVSKDVSIDQIRSITTSEDGKVWIGTSGQGLTLYDPISRDFETIYLPPIHTNIGNPNRVVSLLSDKKGDVWVGTQDNGLIILDRFTKKIKKRFFKEASIASERIPDNTIWCILENGQGQYWLGTRDAGLLLLDKNKGLIKRFIKTPVHLQQQDENSIRSIIAINDSTLAVGFEKIHGVQLVNTNTGTFTNLDISPSDTTRPVVKSLYINKGWLWIGTSGEGLLATHLETGNTLQLNEENGLPNNVIYGILPQSDSCIWASTNRGLFRFNFQISRNQLQSGQISAYTVSDGLQSPEFNTGAFHRSERGTMYFGGISGLNYFDPDHLVFSDNSKKTVLTEVMVGNIPVQADTLITYKNSIQLKYYDHSLGFSYTAFDFISPDKSTFYYKLEGYDEDWVAAGNRKYTAYTNLLPGEYQFLVKSAKAPDDKAHQAALTITIAAPFWLEWWFILAVLLLVILLLYGTYKYRVNQIIHIQQVKNTISADLHDEIGSKLTNIHLLSVISKNKLKGADPMDTLEKIDREARLSAEALDEIVWNIKISDESLLDIVTRMRRHASEVLENDGINYEIVVGSGFRRKKMSMQKRRELFMVFKELLTNVRKHAKASYVTITIVPQKHGISLKVVDNGVGFDTSGESLRNGIRNIQFRMEKWKGWVQFHSRKEKGTTAEVWVPFESNWLYRILDRK